MIAAYSIEFNNLGIINHTCCALFIVNEQPQTIHRGDEDFILNHTIITKAMILTCSKLQHQHSNARLEDGQWAQSN